MHHHDTARLDEAVAALRENLQVVADFEEIIPLWKRPGWTTPAEFLLVEGMLASMVAISGQLVEMKQLVHAGARAVAAEEVATAS